MPPRKGTRKRVAEPPAEAEASEASDTQAPAPKKPRGLGRANTRSRSGTPASIGISEASTAKGKAPAASIAEDTEADEETGAISATRTHSGPYSFEQEGYLNHLSYVVMEQMAGGVHAPPRKVYPPRQQRWKHDGEEPITNINDVPEGWNANERDLDPDDINAQIDRCFERIEDGIMPQVFDIRLESYLAIREARNAMIDSEPKGLSFEIVQRLDALKIIKNHLETQGDPDEQLSNVRALLKAYREGKLEWSQGMVSYWSNGVQLNEPTKFNRELHEKMQQENDATKSWWVEGLLQSGPTHMGLFGAWPPYNAQSAVKFDLHVTTQSQPIPPATMQSLVFSALHDTGADLMAIPRESLDELEGLGNTANVLGWALARTPGGILCTKVIELEVTMEIPYLNNMFLSCWLKVPAGVIEARPGANEREIFLSGPFPRFSFYTATCPDGTGFLYLSHHKDELNGFMPELPLGYVFDQPPPVALEPSSPGGGPPAHMVLAIKQAAAAAAAAGGGHTSRGGSCARGNRGGRGRGRGRAQRGGP